MKDCAIDIGDIVETVFGEAIIIGRHDLWSKTYFVQFTDWTEEQKEYIKFFIIGEHQIKSVITQK